MRLVAEAYHAGCENRALSGCAYRPLIHAVCVAYPAPAAGYTQNTREGTPASHETNDFMRRPAGIPHRGRRVGGPHPMRFSVRRAVPDDASQLSRLAREAKAHWNYPAEWLTAWLPQLTIEPRYLIEHRVLVAEDTGRLVGMCALEDRGTCWSLEHVWVNPASMGQGVGRTLVQQALDLARAVRPGRVVAEADPHAAGFYRRMGASEIGAAPAPMPGAPDRALTVFAFVIG